MAILNQKRILNLIPKVSAPVTIHVSQGDVGTQIEFTLVKGDEVFVNPGNITASVHGVREDGANFGLFTCTLSGSTVSFPLHSEMTAVKGSALAEIVLVDNDGNKVGSANFGILVEESVFPLGVTYDNDVSVYESILAYVQTIPAQVEADITSAVAQEAQARAAADAAFTSALSTTNSNIASEVSARESADVTINARIDEIIAPSGEAPSAAEVTDARIGLNGVTYPSLGNSMRTQLDFLFGGLNEKTDIFNFIYSENNNYMSDADYIDGGYIKPSDGSIVESSNWKYKYQVIPCVGTYKIRKSVDEWGAVNQTKITLLYGDKTFYKQINGTKISDDVVEFTITEADFKFATFVAISTRKNMPNPMLILNSTYPSDLVYSAPLWKFNSEVPRLSYLENRILDSRLFERSLSGNLLKNTDYEDGYYSGTGLITSGGSNLKHGLVPIVGIGKYIKRERQSTYGTANVDNFVFLNSSKVAIKSKQGTRIDDNTYYYIVTEDDIKDCVYLNVNVDTNHPELTAGLYYAEQLPNYVVPANMGDSTDILYKKVLISDGDSIADASSDLPFNLDGYYGRLTGNYSMLGKSYAVGGGTITAELYTSGGNARHWVSRSIDTIYNEYPTLDYLILEGGTNDADIIGRFNGDTPPEKFGTWNENDFGGDYDDETFCGAVESLFYKALNYYPLAKIGFIIAMPMGSSLPSISNRKRYFDEICKIAKKWHIPILNLWENSGVDPRLTIFWDSTKTSEWNVANGKFYLDGQHPTSWGYNKMQNMIESWVRSL